MTTRTSPRTKTVKSGKSESSYSTHAGKRIGGPHLRLRNYKQQDYHSCGFVAALTVAHYFNPLVTDKTVLRAVRPHRWGVDRRALVKALEKLGIRARTRYDLTVATLRHHIKDGMPIIVSVWPEGWDTDHWTVVQGFSARRIYLTNHYSLPVTSFKREWSDMDMRGQGGSGEGITCRMI